MRTPDSGNDFERAYNSKWRACVWCGPVSNECTIYFDSGSHVPVVGETITGATTTDTGVVESVYLRSGTWGGGDAAGCLILTSPTGWTNEEMWNFQDNENLNGSTAGANFATADGQGSVSATGILYPQEDMVLYNGVWYCRPHFYWRFGTDWKTLFVYKSQMESDRYREP